MADGQRSFFQIIRRAVEAPGLGPLLYRVNVNPFVVRKMVAGHVYKRCELVDPGTSYRECRVIDAPGARFGSAAFVTGALDRIATREEFLALAERAGIPLLVVYGAETPPRSRAEIEALAAVPAVQSVRLARSKLSVHEELPDHAATAIRPFLLQ